MMLPSNFQRTRDGLNTLDMSKVNLLDDTKSLNTAGPADYQIERVIGRDKIAQAQIRNCPQYSFGRTQTHRTLNFRNTATSLTGSNSNSKRNIKPYGKTGNQNYISVEPVTASGYKYVAAEGNEQMIYHKCDDFQTPGVGDYNIGHSFVRSVQQKSPQATIGRSARFLKPNSLNVY